MEFLKLRAARLGKDELCAVDSTSRSAYGDCLADIHYGRNKEGLPLEQTTEAVVYTLTNHMPIYYRTFPGNMNDSRSLSTMLADLDHAGFKDLILITDRGYESIQNLDQYILRGQKFISCAKISGSEISKAIKKITFLNGIPTNMNFDTEKEIYYKQLKSEHIVERLRRSQKVSNKLNINLYFDPYRHLEEIITLQKDIIFQQKSIEELIKSKTPIFNPVQMKKEHSYFNYVIHPKKNIIQSFILNDKKVSKLSDQAGFFSIKTHGIKFSAIETYKVYRLRDEQEKFFNVMKTQMLAGRQRNSSEDGKTGRLFILFIALILISYIRNIWKTTKLHEIFPTSFDMVHEMRSIRCIEHANRARVLTPFVGGQLDICEAFGFEVPKGCAPTNAPSQKTKRKRGRPAKRPIERDL
jgi:transposase